MALEEDAAESRRAAANARAREHLLITGWEPRLRGGLLLWKRPDGRGSWYTQQVALEILEAMEGKASQDVDER